MTATVPPRAPTFLGLPTAPRGVGHLRGEQSFPDAARGALRDGQLRANLGHATATIRGKRARVVAELPDWAELREAGRALKAATMARLDDHLETLERQVTARGGGVIQGVRHRELPVEGVQFHPESVLTEGGHTMLANWLAACGLPAALDRAPELAAEAETRRLGAFV